MLATSGSMGQFQEGNRDEAVGDEGHQQRLEEEKKKGEHLRKEAKGKRKT